MILYEVEQNQCLNCEERSDVRLEARRRRREDERRRRENRGAVGAEGRVMGRGCPPPIQTRGSGASSVPPAGSGAEPRTKMNLTHFVAAIKTLIATICLICFIKHCSCSLSLLF